MGFIFGQLTVRTQDAQIENLEAQLINNEERENAQHIKSSNETTKIHRKYDYEEELIQNEMDKIEDKTSDEYFDLMAEKKDLKEAEDKDVEQIEIKETEVQDKIERENATIEERKKALEEDKEATQENTKEDAQNSFAYFQ